MGLNILFYKTTRKKIGNFRKINFLVSFFENVLNKDANNCKPLIIDELQVKNLLDRCEKVLEDHSLADKLLPTMDGFFFGPTSYDEEYFENVEKVKKFIQNKLLKQFDILCDGENIEFCIDY